MTWAKAIETEWMGCRFRSRTEARWAIVFESLGLSWEYEPEGFQTSLGPYLPDFFLTEIGAWVEIKPRRTDDDSKNIASRKLHQIVAPHEYGVIIFGSPFGTDWRSFWGDMCPAYQIQRNGYLISRSGDGIKIRPASQLTEEDRQFIRDRKKEILFGIDWQENPLLKLADNQKDVLARALESGRRARFEHGEKPEVKPGDAARIRFRIPGGVMQRLASREVRA